MNKAKRQSTERLRSWVPELRALAERSAKSFVQHDMAVYAMALAYRGLFTLLPFAVFLVAVLSFLRVDAVFGWLAEQGPPGLRGRLPELIEWLESEALGQTQGVLLWAGIVLAFWPVTMGTRLLTKAFNAVFEVEETHPAWRRVASSLTLAPGLALVVITAVGLMLFTSRAIVWLSCLLPFRYKALVSPCKFPANQIPTLRFRALLVEEAPKVELALV
jgi:membrane protein